MSLITSHSVDCPCCGAGVSVPLYESVNVSLEPALKERVLKRTLNCADCPTCGETVAVEADLLYHDMQKQLMVWLRLDKLRECQLPLQHHTLRIVHSYDALIEKVLIYETSLDDCVIELLKYILWPDASGRKPEEYRGDEIRFTGEEGGDLSFLLFAPEGTKGFSFPKSEVPELAPLVAKARANAPAGSWHVVDRDFLLAGL